MKTEVNEPISPTMMGVGLTKREHFAIIILQGLVSDPVLTTNKTPLETAHIALVYVDALIEELNKE